VCEICGARFRGEPSACPLDGGTLYDAIEPLVGRRLADRYELGEKIAAGATGPIYRADALGRSVAVKLLLPDLAADPVARRRFLDGARIASGIEHPHVVDVRDFGSTDDGLVFLVMELVDGRPLSAAIGPTGMPVRRALWIALQTAQGLACVHELDAVHGAIDSEHVMLLNGHETDFAKILGAGLPSRLSYRPSRNAIMVLAPPEYLAPEVVRGGTPTPSTDLYALGCILFEMSTGRIPFEGGTVELMAKQVNEPPPRPSEHARGVPPAVDSLVLRLLAKNAEDRPETARAVIEEVAEILATLGDAHAR
jgi:serine/threonine-protein kinase